MAQSEHNERTIYSCLKQFHSGRMSKYMRRQALLRQRGAVLLRHGRMFGYQILDGVGTQRTAARTGKQDFWNPPFLVPSSTRRAHRRSVSPRVCIAPCVLFLDIGHERQNRDKTSLCRRLVIAESRRLVCTAVSSSAWPVPAGSKRRVEGLFSSGER